MKKKLLIVATVCASLFVVAPAVSVSAAEVESESQVQTIQNDDIGIAPCADEIVTKFRLYKKTKLQYRRWNQTRGYWVDKDWIDSFANYNSSGSSHACACCSYSEARERRSPAEHGSQSSFSASVR